TDAGTVAWTVSGERREYDVVVLAAGAWTPALLRSAGLPADGYRVKSIQYAVYRADGWRPPPFVDEVTGLYGRPTADGGLLLGWRRRLREDGAGCQPSGCNPARRIRSTDRTQSRRTQKRSKMIDEETPVAGLPFYHTVGIGAGPANLSLAALFESSTAEKIA